MKSPLGDMTAAADTFGHIGLSKDVNQISRSLAAAGANEEASKLMGSLHDALSSRKVLKSVLKDIKKKKEKMADED